MVVVGAAARRVHRRGRHGVEGEDELFTVAHAWRLGVVPGDTWGRATVTILKQTSEKRAFDISLFFYLV